MKQEYKKTAVDLTDLAIGIVILGMVVAIGATILLNIRDSQVRSLPVGQIANETVAPSEAGTQLTGTGWVKEIYTVTNSTGLATITAPNYTLTVDANGVGFLSNSTCSLGTDGCASWKVTYNVYNKSDPRYALPQNASIGIEEYGNWFKIIVIVGVAALVLSIIFMAFGRQGAEGGVAY